MKIKEIVGIDISKLTIDVVIHTTKNYKVFDNKIKGFKKLLKWIYKSSEYDPNDIYILFEHTGRYALQLSHFLTQKKLLYKRLPPLQIKRSMGIVRSKNDKVDAKVIAHYGYRIKEELSTGDVFNATIQFIHSIVTLKDRLIKQRAGMKSSLKEDLLIPLMKNNKSLIKTQKDVIKMLDGKIKLLQKEILLKIKNDEHLYKIFKLINSVKGVGIQTATYIIIHTNGFKKYKTWRQFASFCGVAPFTHQSGTSVRGRTRVSNLANKKMKSLLYMCAISSLQYNPEIKQYYERRVESGKNKMSTINVIKNKILSRIFAVVDRGTPYVDIFKYAV